MSFVLLIEILPLGLILILSRAEVVLSVGAVWNVKFAKFPSIFELYITTFAPPTLSSGW